MEQLTMATNETEKTAAERANELEAELAHFMGGGDVYAHWLGYTYTEGVKCLCDGASAYWLVDLIASYRTRPRVRREPFVVWRLVVDLKKGRAVAIADDGNGVELARQRIPYTDFPLAEVKLYVENGLIMLPSER